MNSLKSARQEIRLLLSAAGIDTHEYIPSRVNVPAALVEPGSPYMEQGETFVEFVLRFNVVLLVSGTNNENATDELDALITKSIDTLDTFFIEQVDAPEAIELNNAIYLGSRITITTNKDLVS